MTRRLTLILPEWGIVRHVVLDTHHEHAWIVGSVPVGMGWETAEQLINWDGEALSAEVAVMGGNHVLHVTGSQDDYTSLGFLGDLNDANVLEARIQFLDLGPDNGSIDFNLKSRKSRAWVGLFSAHIDRRGVVPEPQRSVPRH